MRGSHHITYQANNTNSLEFGVAILSVLVDNHVLSSFHELGGTLIANYVHPFKDDESLRAERLALLKCIFDEAVGVDYVKVEFAYDC